MKLGIRLVFLALMSGALIWRFSQSVPHTARLSEAVESVPPPALRFRWEAPSQVYYELDYRVNATGAEGWTLHTRMAVTSSNPDSAQAVLQFRFFETSAPDEPEFEALLPQAPVEAVVALDGRILDIRLPAEVSAGDAARISNLLYACQTVLRPEAAYDLMESDANGPSDWHYEQKPGSIQKQRRRIQTGPGDPFRSTVVQSSITAVPGAFWLESLQGHEILAIAMVETGTVLAQPETEWTLRRIAPPATQPPAKPLPNGMTSALAPGRASATATNQDALRTRYAGISIQTALAQLASDPESFSAITSLSDLLKAYPERSEELAILLRDAGLPDPVRARAMHALELAARDVPAAQTALTRLLRQPEAMSPEALSQAIVAAGGVGQVQDPELVEALSSIATSNPDSVLSDAATFALGRLAKTNPSVRDRIVPGLEAILNDPNRSVEDVKMALWTLRNGRITSEALRGKAQAWSQTTDPDLREAAETYLRLYGSSGH